MTSAAVGYPADVAKLLEPIPGDRPTGISLRFEGTYDLVRDARREDDPNLPQGVWRAERKQARWPEVDTVCRAALQRSKDLQIAVWLMEAWIHLHGFPGASASLSLIMVLCEAFWPDLYPAVDDADPDVRSAPFDWINEKLPVAAMQTAITLRTGSRDTAWTWAHRQDLLRRENLAKQHPESADEIAAEGRGTREEFSAAVAETPLAFYETGVEDLTDAVANAVALQRFLDETCGKTAPSIRRFTSTLETLLSWMEGVRDQKRPVEPIEVVPDPVPASSPPAERSDDVSEIGEGRAVGSRAEAYRMLSDAAGYLLRIEPHSPTPYLVRRAVAWGDMTLAELFEEFVREGYDLRAICNLLGIARTDQE